VTPLAGAVFVLLLGAIYAFYTPPFQVADEPAHFFRAYELTTGSCQDQRSARFPLDMLELSRRFPDHLNELDAVDDLNARLAAAERAPRASTTVPVDLGGATASYSCLTYIPAALGAAAALAFKAPMIAVLYAARLGNVIAFSVVALLVLLLLPLGLRPVALLIMAMPMSLAQAASSSQDAIVNCLALLFVAYVAWLAWSPQRGVLSRRDIAGLIGFAVVLGQCKLDFVLIPLIVLIPRERWSHGVRAQLATLAGALVLGLGGLAAWQHFGVPPTTASATVLLDHAANERFLLHQPGLVLQRFFATVQLDSWFYLDSFVGRLGWLNVELPTSMIVAYAIALVAAAVMAPTPPALTPARRALCVALILAAIGATFLVFWIVGNPIVLAMQFAMGDGYFEGVQGRYFIPFALPLAFAIGGLLPMGRRLTPSAMSWGLLGAAVVACVGSAAAYAAIYSEFYYPQQEVGRIPYRLRHPGRFYEGKFIQQTGAKKSDNQILYVYHGRRYWIETPRWFRKHHVTVKPEELPATFVRRIVWGGMIWDADTEFRPTSMALRYDETFVIDQRGAIWLVAHGVRHRILAPGYIYRDGYPVARPSARDLAAIPVGDPIEDFRYLNGSTIQATDARDPAERARVYFIEDGRKRWITDPDWLKAHEARFGAVRSLPFATVDRIPNGYPLP
jgi:uncharacterized membrane protein